MIVLSIEVTVSKKNQPEFLETLYSLANEVKSMPGCESFRMYHSESEDFVLLELEWEGKKALDTYVHSKNFLITYGAIRTFCDVPDIKVGYLFPIDHAGLLQGNY